MSDATETETAAEVPRPLPLRRNHGFRMLWIGQLLSDSGSEVGIRGPLVNFAFNGVLFTIILAMRQHGSSALVIGLVQAAIMGAVSSAV